MARVTGGSDIAKALQQISINISGPIKDAQRKALKPMLAAAKANVPVETGRLRKILTIKADPSAPKSRPTFQVGPNSADPHYRVAHLVEYGTAPHEIDGKHHPGADPQPFLTPAFEATGAEVLRKFGEEIGPAIERAGARARARAARKSK